MNKISSLPYKIKSIQLVKRLLNLAGEKNLKNLNKFRQLYNVTGVATLAFFVLIFVILSIVSPFFLTVTNMLALLRQITAMLIAGVGITYLVIAGGIDLSIGSLVGVTGVVSALLVSSFNFPVAIAIILGVLCGGLVGLINGLLVTKVYLPPLLATLGMMVALRGLAFIISGGHTIRGLPESYLWLGRGRIFGIFPVSVLLMIIIFLSFLFILKNTKFGLYMYVIGGNRISARKAGIKDNMYLNLAFVFSGLMAGLAGVLVSSRIGAGLPQAGNGFELDVITGVVIGGTSIFGGAGKLEGTLLGVLIIGMITNGMLLLDIHSYWQQVAKGLILVIAVGAETIKQLKKD